MKGALPFDPRDYDYSPAIHAILAEWSDIDWFVPTPATDDDLLARFRAHADTPAHVVTGDFTAWCERVRTNDNWDWRFGVLKKRSRAHAESHGWRIETHARLVTAEDPPRPGDLCFRLETGLAVWNHATPKLDDIDEHQRFYLGYAHGDLLDAVKWQLAEPRAELAANPFVALVRCYAAGAYPFSLDAHAVALFRF